MSLAERIAEYVCSTGIEDFSPAVVERAKGLCLSALGSTVLGSTMAVSRTMADYVRQTGSNAQAGVVGMGFRASREWAAALNCISSHCTEYEDVAWPEAQYTCFLLPAMFTLGDALGASGRAVLEAIVIGFEVAARPGMTCSDHGAAARGFLSCANVGTIGAAAGAAKLMGLDRSTTRDAITLAASLGGGLVRQTGSAAHVVEAGFAARDGIMAASLAAQGIGGTPTIFDGKQGYFDALAGQPEIAFDLGRGDDLRVMAVGYKKYPCCYLLQRIIDALRAMIDDHGLDAADVAKVEVEVNEAFPNIVKFEKPVDVEQARFSLPFMVAAVLAGEPMDWRTFSEDALGNPQILDQLHKTVTTIIPNSGFEQLSRSNRIIITLADGETLTTVCSVAHGDASDPLSTEEVAAGFLAKTEALLSRDAAADVTRMVASLDTLPDVRPLMALMA